MKKALIIGCSGQDGILLARLLKTKGYYVAGLSRAGQNPNCDEHVLGRVTDEGRIAALVERVKPDELYYFAAYNFSSQECDMNRRQQGASETFAVSFVGYLNALEAVEKHAPQCRVFYACSSLIYGQPLESPQTEATPPRPACLYSIAKLAGRHLSEHYRERKGMHISVGILYNHESIYRQDRFLSKRIVVGVKAILNGSSTELVLGDLGAKCDWGYAGDFVEAMWLMLQQARPDTYLVATGKLHTVRDWVDTCFRLANLNARAFVREDSSLLTRRRSTLCGDSSKLRAVTGWEPRTSFHEMVKRIYRDEG